MDSDERPSAPRKVRFAPKAPPKRILRKATVPKTEAANDEDDARTQRYIRQFNERLERKGSKAEKKSAPQIVFGHGAKSSTTMKTYGGRTSGSSGKSIASGLKESISDEKQDVSSSPSTVDSDEIMYSSDVEDATAKNRKGYKEPWDYKYSYYPTTLPLRRPNSGDPEILDQAEFGEASINKEYDENSVNSALELGLLEESENKEMFVLKLPGPLPLLKRSASAKGKEIFGRGSKKGCNFEDLPGGYMGKMLVYKSGAVKLKLGDTLFDVSPGVDCTCAQEVAAVNTEKKHFCVLGDIRKTIVVTPDIDSLLDPVDPVFQVD